MSEKKLTNNVGAPVADNQPVMTAGPKFCAKKNGAMFF
jgi:catalase